MSACFKWYSIAVLLSSYRTASPLRLILREPWVKFSLRVERLLDAWPEIAPAVGLAGSRVMSAVVDVWGWRARFALARGQTIEEVTAKLPSIESGLGTFRGAARVLPTADRLANRFELRVLDKDPHALEFMMDTEKSTAHLGRSLAGAALVAPAMVTVLYLSLR